MSKMSKTYKLWGLTLPRPLDRSTFKLHVGRRKIAHNKTGALRLQRLIRMWHNQTGKNTFPSDLLAYEGKLKRKQMHTLVAKHSFDYMKNISRDGKREVFWKRDQRKHKDNLHVTCFKNKDRKDCHGTVREYGHTCHYGFSRQNPYCKKCAASYWPETTECEGWYSSLGNVVTPYFERWRRSQGY